MKIPKELMGFGLVSPKRQTKRRLIMTTEAETGCGKSRLMLATAPRPLLHIDIDNNSEDMEEEWVGDDILVFRANLDPVPTEAGYLERLKVMRKLLFTGLDKDVFRSYSIDTGDKLWDWVQIALLGSKEFGENSRTEYRACNNVMHQIFDACKEKRVNLCVANHMKPERVATKTPQGKKSSEETGRKVVAGWKHMTEQSQLHVKLFKDPTVPGSDMNKFGAEIMKCTIRTSIEGMQLFGDEISVKTLGKLVFPQSEPEEWE